MIGLVAGVLLLGGGLTALQPAAIVAGLPFAVGARCRSRWAGFSRTPPPAPTE